MRPCWTQQSILYTANSVASASTLVLYTGTTASTKVMQQTWRAGPHVS